MKVEIEYDESESGGFTPLPEGTYPCIVRDATMKPPNDSGNRSLECLFEVTDGPLAGRRFRSWYYQTQKASWKTKKLLDATGIEYEEKAVSDTKKILRFDTDDLIGARLKMIATAKEYEGKKGNDFEELAPDAANDGTGSSGSASSASGGAATGADSGGSKSTPEPADGGAQPQAQGGGFVPKSRR